MRNKATGGRAGGRTGGKKSTGSIRKNDISKGKPGFAKSQPTENKNRPKKGERAGERGEGGFSRDREDTGRFAKKGFGGRPSDSRGDSSNNERKPFNRDGAKPAWGRGRDDNERSGDSRGERSGSGDRREGGYKGKSEGRPYGEKKPYGSKEGGRGESGGRPERKPFNRGGDSGGRPPFNKNREEGSDRGERFNERGDRSFSRDGDKRGEGKFNKDKRGSYGEKKSFGSRDGGGRGEDSNNRERRSYERDGDKHARPAKREQDDSFIERRSGGYDSSEGRFKGRRDNDESEGTRNEEGNDNGSGENGEDQKPAEIKLRKYNNERNDKGRYARHKEFDDKYKAERESRPRFVREDDESDEEETEEKNTRKEDDGDRPERKPFVKGEFSKSRRASADGDEKRGFTKERKDGKSLRPRTSDSSAKRSDWEPGRKKTKEDKQIRLNKFIANAGLCSRREADEMISAGVVSVNGVIVTELGYKANPTDEIRYNGEIIKTEKTVYLLLNKPKDFITTTDDPEERRTVMALIENACRERIYPVGRLDRATTGLLLFTNDGELTKKLTHPSGRVKKIYHVELDKSLKASDMKKIVAGLELEDGLATVDAISYVGEGADKKQIGVELHSGKNRIVRRIFESLDYKVHKLDRVYFAGLTKKDLARGKWRFLTEMELNMLKML